MLKDKIYKCGSYWYDIATDKKIFDDAGDYLFNLGIVVYDDETMMYSYADKKLSIDIMQLEIVRHADEIAEILQNEINLGYINGIQLEKARYIIDNADDIKRPAIY